MKYNKILFFFGIALPLCVLMRTVQIFFTVDFSTGFIIHDLKGYGYGLSAVIIAFCAVLVLICFNSHNNPDNPPRKNLSVGVPSLILAVVTAYELFAGNFFGAVSGIRIVFFVIIGIASVISFAVYGFSNISSVKFRPILAVLPVVYFIVKIIFTFTAVYSLAVITDDLLLISAYCVILLFFLAFAKLYNGIDTETNFRKLMAWGLCGSVLCFTQAVPHIIVNLARGFSYLHVSVAENLGVLASGIFLTAFTLTHFSKRDCIGE